MGEATNVAVSAERLVADIRLKRESFDGLGPHWLKVLIDRDDLPDIAVTLPFEVVDSEGIGDFALLGGEEGSVCVVVFWIDGRGLHHTLTRMLLQSR